MLAVPGAATTSRKPGTEGVVGLRPTPLSSGSAASSTWANEAEPGGFSKALQS